MSVLEMNNLRPNYIVHHFYKLILLGVSCFYRTNQINVCGRTSPFKKRITIFR